MAEQAAPPSPLSSEPSRAGDKRSLARRALGIARDLAIFACLFLVLSTVVGRLRAPDLEGAAPPDPKGEKLIRAVQLSEQEQADLIAFLESLTDESLTPTLRASPPSPDDDAAR